MIALRPHELRDLVNKHRVTYEVARAMRLIDGHLVPVGYDLTLCGTKGHGPTEDSTNGREIWDALRAVAESVRPSDDPEHRTIVEAYDHAVHYAPRRNYRSDIELVLELRHREDRPEIDADEERCLEQMESELEALGVCAGEWRD